MPARPDAAGSAEDPVGSPGSASGRAADAVTPAQSALARTRTRRVVTTDEPFDTIGAVAAGIAHDFNNLLTVIRGFSELHIASHDPADPSREDIVEISRAADRAALLVRQLLAVGRRQPTQPRHARLSDLVQHVLPAVREVVGDTIDVVVRADPGTPDVLVDATQLAQVIDELAANARDAMPDGGTLTIETSPAQLDASFANAHPGTAPGLHARLAVSDTGRGMDDEARRRAFEPFFTTKQAGQGTGLGLASVYGIVRQAGGSIDVESARGSGTTFRIFLPPSVSAAEAAPSVSAAEAEAAASPEGAADAAARMLAGSPTP